MMQRHLSFNTGTILALAAISILGLSGCASTQDEDAAGASETGSEFSDAGATADAAAAAAAAAGASISIDAVYFDYDRSDIRADALPVLKAAADMLKESGQRLVIAGHCDSRGSEEYNLALGERRAASVRRHLANLGVPMSQLSIVSYGEIRPAAQGNTESAWAMNRRAEFSAGK